MLAGVRRVLINGLALLSAVLCVAASVMWVHSHYWEAGVRGGLGLFSFVVWSEFGRVTVFLLYEFGRLPSGFDIHPILSARVGHTTMFGFSLRHLPDRGLGRQVLLTIPYWFLLILFSIVPIIRWRMGRRVAAAGVCGQCGYDMRATPERCPECGAVPYVPNTSA